MISPHFQYQVGLEPVYSMAVLEKNVIGPRLILFFLYSLSQKQLLFVSGLSGCNIATRRCGSWFQHVSLVRSQSWCSGAAVPGSASPARILWLWILQPCLSDEDLRIVSCSRHCHTELHEWYGKILNIFSSWNANQSWLTSPFTLADNHKAWYWDLMTPILHKPNSSRKPVSSFCEAITQACSENF